MTGQEEGRDVLKRKVYPTYCPRCGAENKPPPEPCTAERFRWDEDDQGHHCRERGPHTVHTCIQHGCRWIAATNAEPSP